MAGPKESRPVPGHTPRVPIDGRDLLAHANRYQAQGPGPRLRRRPGHGRSKDSVNPSGRSNPGRNGSARRSGDAEGSLSDHRARCRVPSRAGIAPIARGFSRQFSRRTWTFVQRPADGRTGKDLADGIAVPLHTRRLRNARESVEGGCFSAMDETCARHGNVATKRRGASVVRDARCVRVARRAKSTRENTGLKVCRPTPVERTQADRNY
jgi:hypothetical protein